MTCSLIHHGPGCDGCGRKLTGRQSRWCSRACMRKYTANHRWTQAKAAAKAEAQWFLCARATNLGVWDCEGTPAIDVRAPDGCEVFTKSPEVNHIEPCKGKHGTWGCHHHQENLEVLCRPCHLAATAEQRKAGKL